MKSKITNPKINIKIIRLGLLYGLEDCPIRNFVFVRKIHVEIYPGKPEKVFAVTDAEDITNYLLNTESELWHSQQTQINFYESEKSFFKIFV